MRRETYSPPAIATVTVLAAEGVLNLTSSDGYPVRPLNPFSTT